MHKPITISFLQELVWENFRKRGKTIKSISMSPFDFADIRKFGRDTLNIEHNMENLKKGIQGTLFGVTILTMGRNIKQGELLVDDTDDIRSVVCMHCHQIQSGTTCTSDICVVRTVLEA